jgi:hypothetical protein
MISSVCLEGDYYEPFFELLPNLKTFLLRRLKIEDKKSKDQCDGPKLQKLKFSHISRGVHRFQHSYSYAMMKDKILLEISLELDQFETKTQRDSTDIFEWLGDIGGLQLVMEVVLGTVAQFFSAKYMSKEIT